MFSSPPREQPTYLPPSEQKRKPKKDASLTTSSCERHISECSVLCSKLVLFWELNQVLGFAAACESKNRRHQTLYTIVNLCDLHAEELKTHPLSSSWTKCEILLFVFCAQGQWGQKSKGEIFLAKFAEIGIGAVQKLCERWWKGSPNDYSITMWEGMGDVLTQKWQYYRGWSCKW